MKVKSQKIVEVYENPVSLEEARSQCYLDVEDSDGHPQDPMLSIYIKAATKSAENFTGLSFSHKLIEAVLDSFPSECDKSKQIIELTPPLISIESVKYYDLDGILQTLDETEYSVDSISFPAVLKMKNSKDFPKTAEMQNAVVIRYETGYGTSDTESVPEEAKIAILLTVGHFFENRQDVVEKQSFAIPNGAESLLRPIRINLGMA